MNVLEYASVAELLAGLHDEATRPARFPVRFILVSGYPTWRTLINALRSECGVFHLSSLCRGEDLLPHLSELRASLQQDRVEHVLVLPYGEVLRLSPGLAPTKSLATWQSAGAKRVYIPILDGSDILLGQLEGVSRYRDGECSVWSVHGEGQADIHVAPFAVECSRRKVVAGIRAYLQLWEQQGAAEVLLVSRIAPHLQERYGSLQFGASPDAFSVLQRFVANTEGLRPEWGTEDQWRWLASQARAGDSLPAIAARQLNMVHFDHGLLFGQWRNLSEHQRWLGWLWARLQPPSDDCLSLVVREARTAHDLPSVACQIVFEHDLSPGQLRDRRSVLQRLGLGELPASFWSSFHALDDPLARLRSLPGLSPLDRERVVLEVGQLIRAHVPDEEWLPYVAVSYPELAAYLTARPYADARLRPYMEAYTRSKVSDEFQDTLSALAQSWVEDRAIWGFATRASRLNVVPEGSKVLWIDALGIEWAGLLHELLDAEGMEASLTLARAELPTSTRYNKDWADDEAVERELDRLAHDYDYRYPRTLVRQLRWISEFVRVVRSACEANPYVVITSDHGLTRFASSGTRIDPPPGYDVHKWGRYATTRAHARADTPESREWVVYRDSLVLQGHSLFSGGARTRGEVHGGATVEECLVPVLVVRMRSTDAPRARILEDVVRLDARGQGDLTVELTAPVSELRLATAGLVFEGTRETGNRWIIRLAGLRTGAYTAKLQYDKGTLSEIRFEVIRGIAEEDIGL